MTIKTRERAEALIIVDGGFVMEKLLDPKYPRYLGNVRALGGAIEKGETPTETIIREFMEEYGIRVDRQQISPYRCYSGDFGPVFRYMVRRLNLSNKIGMISNGGKEQLVLSYNPPDPFPSIAKHRLLIEV